MVVASRAAGYAIAAQAVAVVGVVPSKSGAHPHFICNTERTQRNRSDRPAP
jgi:hypothetical protein